MSQDAAYSLLYSVKCTAEIMNWRRFCEKFIQLPRRKRIEAVKLFKNRFALSTSVMLAAYILPFFS
jgi:hypothetical protein